jgi:hypothetical protein
VILLFGGLCTGGKMLIQEIRETPARTAVSADIFIAGENVLQKKMQSFLCLILLFYIIYAACKEA